MTEDCELFQVYFMERLPTTTRTYIQAALHYFPNKLRQSFTAQWPPIYEIHLGYHGSEAMRFLHAFAAHDLEKYGTDREILDQLEEFVDFQGNIDYFSMDPSTHFNHKPRVVNRSQKDRYFSKTDVFTYIQNKLVQKNEMMRYRVPMTVMAYFLKHHEKKLEGTCEFVLYDYDGFKWLEDQLDRISKDMTAAEPGAHATSCEQVFRKLKNILPNGIKAQDMQATMDTLKEMWNVKEFDETFDEKRILGMAECWYQQLKVMFAGIQKIMKERPQWFLPNVKVDPKLLPSKPIIRLFLDDHSSFVLSRELASVIKIPNYTKDESDIMETLNYESAEFLCVAHNVQATFVEIPIRRAKLRAVPIPSGTGTCCILAADVLLEQIREMTFEYHAFETANNQGEMLKLLEEFSKIFDPEESEIFMFTAKRVREIEAKVAARLAQHFSGGQIGKVAPRGFTLGELKFSLEILTLDKFFKDITSHAKVVYDHVNAKKAKKQLRLCDMLDAIDNCVKISFFKKFPKFAQFLHNQESCHRVHGYECPRCDEEKKKIPQKATVIPVTISLKNPSEVAVPESSAPKTAPKMDSTKTATVLPKNPSKVTVPDSETKVEVPKPKSPVPPKPSSEESPKVAPKPSETAPKSPNSETPDPLNPNKESKCCPDCLPNSEKCDRANEQLKTFTKKESEMRKEKCSMEKELKEMRENEPKMIDVLRKNYLKKVVEVEKELKEARIKDEQYQEKIQGLERKLVAQSMEIERLKRNKMAEEPIRNEFKKAQEKLSAENERFNAEKQEKDEEIKQLQEQLKKALIAEEHTMGLQ